MGISLRHARRALLPFLALAAACGSTSPAGTSSSGASGALWCTDDVVVRVTGGSDNPEAQPLHRVTGAHRFADGRLVVADAGSSSLLFFDRDGRFDHAAGRAGAGPGEYRQLRLLAAFGGDSLVAFDGALRRVTVLDATGRAVRSFTISEVMGTPTVRAVFEDGSTVVQVAIPFHSDSVQTGTYRPDLALLMLDREGGILRDLGRYPGESKFVLVTREGMMVGPLVFGPALQVATAGRRLVVGASDAAQVHVFRDTVIVNVPVPFHRQPATTADFDAAMEEYLQGVPAPARSIERSRFDQMPRLDSLPVFADLRMGPDGEIWLRRELGPRDPRRLWWVIGNDGQPLAIARMPDNSDILELGPDWVVVSQRDSLDVEGVEILPVRRAGCPDIAPLP